MPAVKYGENSQFSVSQYSDYRDRKQLTEALIQQLHNMGPQFSLLPVKDNRPSLCFEAQISWNETDRRCLHVFSLMEAGF